MLVCRPVFKAGEGLVNSGAGGFDSHALPPPNTSAAEASFTYSSVYLA